MNSKSSAGRFANVSATAGALVGLLVVADLAIFTRGLLGFRVVPLLVEIGAVVGVLVGRFFRVVTFLGKPLPFDPLASDWLKPLARHRKALRVPWKMEKKA